MPTTLQAEINHWWAVCRNHVFMDGLIKEAELGGDGQDATFEQAFSNLAHAYLRDKAPTLLDHELGFQLVDRNQDNTKSVGVFAFKVGSQNIFAPVFFLKGQLKGHELLYLRNQDMFVPMKENWLDYILNRKPNILGSGVARQTSQLGVRQPDLNALSQSPSKYAAVRTKHAFWGFGNKQQAAPTDNQVNEVDIGDPVDADNIIFAQIAQQGGNLYVPLGNPNWPDEQVQRRLQKYGLKHYEPLNEDAYNAFLKTLPTAIPKQKMAATNFIPSVVPFMPVFAKLATTPFQQAIADFETHCRERLDLEHFLKQASLPALESLVDLLKRKPVIAAAFDRWHGMPVLTGAVKEARVRLDVKSVLDDRLPVNRNRLHPVIRTGSVLDKWAADSDNGPDYKQKLKIIAWDTTAVTSLPEGLDEADQEKLLKDTLLIKDDRKDEEVSVPVNLQVEQRLTNPTDTGIYQVLVKAGEFEKCLVILFPHGPDGRKEFATVVRLDESTRNWGNFEAKKIWVATQDEMPIPGGEEAWMDWFNKLPDITTVSAESKGRYLLIGPRRNATCPFQVVKEIGTSHGTRSYTVDFSDYLNRPAVYRHIITSAPQRDVDEYDRFYDGQRIHLDSKDGTELRSRHGDLYVPKNYKVMKLAPTKSDKDDDKDDSPCVVHCCSGFDTESDTPPIQPGDLLDATRQLMQKTAALRVRHDGSTYQVNQSQSLTKNAAIIHLVRNHGFREDISRHLLKLAEQADRRRKGAFECRVKYASPFLTDGGGPSAPGMDDDQGFGGYNPMGFAGQNQQPYQAELPIPDMSSANTDPNVYNVNPQNMQEPMDANGVNSAIQTGQKEVFDTAMIGSMLKAVRDDTMIDRYLPDLIKGVDRLGRILFMFYWHQDKFAERYGKQDMPELEDSLRNAFEMNGDVVLFLKQKTIEPYPEEDVRGIDLGSSDN